MVDDIGTVFRDFNNINDPASGEYEPEKPRIRGLLRSIRNSSGSAITRNTLAALTAVTPPTEDYMGVVLDDPDPANNGYYSRVAAAWVWERGFPDTFARVTLGGAANAQTGSVAAGVDPASTEVFFATVSTDNTGPMTLSVDGGAARDVVNLAGNPLTAGEWTGMVMFYLNDANQYQLLIDAGAAASAAASASAADASRILAEAAAGAAGEGAAVVGSRSALAAVDSSIKTAAILKEAGREGTFVFDPSDLASAVTADTAQGTYVAPTAAPTGASGAWKRVRPNGNLIKLSEYGFSEAGLRAACAVAALDPTTMFDLEINLSGTLAFVEGLVVPKNVNLLGKGSGKTVLNFDALGSGDFVADGTWCLATMGDGLVDLGNTFSANSLGEGYIDLTPDQTIDTGDVIKAYNSTDQSWSQYRNEYRAGEVMRIVEKESSTRYWIDRPFLAGYTPGGNTRFYLQRGRGGRLGGFTLDMEGNAEGFGSGAKVVYGDRLAVEDLRVVGAMYTAFQFRQCYDCKLVDSDISTRVRSDFPTGSTEGNDYGISIANSTGTRVRNVRSRANWHAITIGGYADTGAIPNNDTIVSDSVLGAKYTVHSVDIHGNSQNTTYKGCRIFGGINWGGLNSRYVGCDVRLDSAGGSHKIAVLTSELKGGQHEFIGGSIYSSKNAGADGFGMIDVGAGGDVSKATEKSYFNVRTRIVAPLETLPFYFNSTGSWCHSWNIDVEVDIPSIAAWLVRNRRSGAGVTHPDYHFLNVVGMPTGKAFASWEDTIVPNRYNFPRQNGAIDVATGSAASAVTADTALPSAYPAAPRAFAFVERAVGGAPLHVENYSTTRPTAANVQFTVRHADGVSNMPAGTARVLWETVLEKVSA